MSYIKNESELAAITRGGKLMGEILETLLAMVKPGVTGLELDLAAEKMIRASGGIPAFKGYRGRPGGLPFPGTICFSINEELVHGIPTKDKIVQSGDLVSIDIGMQWPARGVDTDKEGGYFTDTAVTMAVGEVPKKLKKLLAVTKEALAVGIVAAQPGNTVASIGRAIETYVKSQGDYGIVRDLVGHGVGHAVHEEPRVPNYYDQSLERWLLEPGVVIAIEPMITLGTHEVVAGADQWTIFSADRSLSAHFEHTIIITAQGPIIVTRRPGEVGL